MTEDKFHPEYPHKTLDERRLFSQDNLSRVMDRLYPDGDYPQDSERPVPYTVFGAYKDDGALWRVCVDAKSPIKAAIRAMATPIIVMEDEDPECLFRDRFDMIETCFVIPGKVHCALGLDHALDGEFLLPDEE